MVNMVQDGLTGWKCQLQAADFFTVGWQQWTQMFDLVQCITKHMKNDISDSYYELLLLISWPNWQKPPKTAFKQSRTKYKTRVKSIHVCSSSLSISSGYLVSRCQAVGSNSLSSNRRHSRFWLASCTHNNRPVTATTVQQHNDKNNHRPTGQHYWFIITNW